MVFDCVVGPAGDELGNLCPLVAPLFVGIVDDSVFLLGPSSLLYFWVEVVVPPLTALLADPTLQVFGDQGPTLGAILLNQLNH